MTFESTDNSAREFITKWKGSAGGELSESQSYLRDLCDLIGATHPLTQAEDPGETYKFERNVTFKQADGTTSPGRVDLFKSGCFVLESKQGTERNSKQKRTGAAKRNTGNWDVVMQKARNQAIKYARALPVGEGWPPFIIVVDIGSDMHIYADFSQQGKNYVQFPDAQGFKIKIDDLLKPEIRNFLHDIWAAPLSLDPSTKSAAVTNEIADHLAALAKSLEADDHEPEYVSAFLMRCIFTMFAEDVELLKKNSFTEMLTNLKGQAAKGFVPMLEALWQDMDKGTSYSVQLQDKVLRFNGYLFKENNAIRMNEDQLELLIEAAEADWRQVEPAIFGTLLERALNPRERHKLGAHYTPRAYVERLIIPTVIEPLKEDWADIQTAAELLLDKGGDKNKEAAKKTVRNFHVQLCETKVLDPACGSANFLYVTMEHMKRLEGEVIEMLEALGDPTPAFTIDPHQFLGIEQNPRASKIAETVLWIGYLQWHFKTFGKTAPAEPVLKDFHNIENRDAVLDWDSREPVKDKLGAPVTIWDRRTTKTHPVTGKEVPDDSAREPTYLYTNPKATKWPQADFIVGNPPFIGSSKMRGDLGDGYVDAIRSAYGKKYQSCDFVMFWWTKAADFTIKHKTSFGLITTNSITQIFNRRIIAEKLEKGLNINFAIPDHPWVDSANGAQVRIAMTSCGYLKKISNLGTISRDEKTIHFSSGIIASDLSQGVDITKTVSLNSNINLAYQGVKLHGKGFLVTKAILSKFNKSELKHIKPFKNGRDLAQKNRNFFVIDVFGLDNEKLRTETPTIFSHLYDNVKPERDLNNREVYRKYWWIFGEARAKMRPMLQEISNYLCCVRTTRYFYFVKESTSTVPESGLVIIGLDGSTQLSVLSSYTHKVWSLIQGGNLGSGNDPTYNHSRCFEHFPFPDITKEFDQKLSFLGEELDLHRKARQAEHSDITLTDMYNILEKIKAEETLNDKEKDIHDRAQVSILKHLHEEIDKAVIGAYGWPQDLSDEEILIRLVALNKERAEEEEQGLIRWLRPSYQNPTGKSTQTQGVLGTGPLSTKAQKTNKPKWPKTMPDQVRAVRSYLVEEKSGISATEIAKIFSRGNVDKVTEVLEALVALGQAQEIDGIYRL